MYLLCKKTNNRKKQKVTFVRRQHTKKEIRRRNMLDQFHYNDWSPVNNQMKKEKNAHKNVRHCSKRCCHLSRVCSAFYDNDSVIVTRRCSRARVYVRRNTCISNPSTWFIIFPFRFLKIKIVVVTKWKMRLSRVFFFFF